nr:methyltransferase domain-containing protein [Methylomonas koyamae]
MAAADSEQIRRRYDRLAPWFDSLEGILEGLLFRRLRKKLWSQASGGHILEVGVGTGKNFAFYPDGARITGIDFSPKMLEQAQRKRNANKLPSIWRRWTCRRWITRTTASIP